MKRLLIALFFLSLSINLFAQSTPVSDLRVATATTTFGINLPIGTKVYNIADGKYWVATAGVISTATLTTASASFTQLNAGTDISGKLNISDTTAMLLNYKNALGQRVKVSDTAAMLNHYIERGDTAAMQAHDRADIGRRVKISDTAAMLTNIKNNINLRVKISDTASMLTNIKNNINLRVKISDTAAMLTNIKNNINLRVKVSDTAAMLNHYSKKTDVHDVPHGGTGLTTITSGSYMIGNGTGNVSLKTPAQVLTDIGAAAAANASLFKVEAFSEATTGATGTSHTLANTPKASTAIQVILNGTPLLASQYTYTSATPAVQITIPVYQYDAVTISYGY